jgi:kynurenine formamidase
MSPEIRHYCEVEVPDKNPKQEDDHLVERQHARPDLKAGPLKEKHTEAHAESAERHLYAEGTTFQIATYELGGNTGTYIDAPFHRHPDEPDLSGLPLEKIANLEGVVVHAAPDGPIGPDAFSGVATAQKALLVRTDWSARWGGDDYLWSDSECAGGSVTGWPVKPGILLPRERLT